METVKVDFQKLQLLNDRIAQTIEALNQLRLSTHSLQLAATFGQAAPAGSAFVFGPQDGGHAPQPTFTQPAFHQPFPQPFYSTHIPPVVAAPGQGMTHVSPTTQTFAQNGLGAYGAYGWVNPYVQQRIQQAYPFLGSAYPPIA